MQSQDPPTPPNKEDAREASDKPKRNEQDKVRDDDWGFEWSHHPSLKFGKGTHLDFRLRLQGDVAQSDVVLPDVESTDADIARRRIGIEGELFNIFDYQVEREIGDEHGPWRDVYVNFKRFGFAQVQGGQFKLPFSLDQNTGPSNLDFVYRSRIAALLSPGRDRGIMAHGRLLDRGILRYEVGLFAEDGDNARTNSDDRVHGDRTIAGRLVVQPFRQTTSLARDLSFGVAVTTSELPAGVSDLRGRTEQDLTFYSPDVLVQGERRRIGFEARWRPGPFSIKSEYIRLSDERLGQSVEDTDLEPFVASGWYVSGTWAVTGEDKANGLDSPRAPLFQGGIGAVELAVRVERIQFGAISSDPLASTSPRAEVILGNANSALTAGVNWYINRWLKIQFNAVRNTIEFPDQTSAPSTPVYWSRLLRFQFSM